MIEAPYLGPKPLLKLTVLAVQPKLQAVSRHIALEGLVKSIFSNLVYMANQCVTPIATFDDKIAAQNCLRIRLAYQGNLDLQSYLGQWKSIFHNDGGSRDLLDRPSPMTRFYDNNTRVVSSWVEVVDTKAVSQINGRIINNVTLAVPHIGIVTAARDSRNGILQQEVLSPDT